MDDQGRTYHLMVKRGDVANRILTVGDTHRATALAKYLENVHKVEASRHFITYTGHYHGTPLTIVASLMGYPNTDFVVREFRAVTDGPLYFIRFGTCGTPDPNLRIGDLAVGRDAAGIIRNPDAFRAPQADPRAYYHITLPVPADQTLYNHMLAHLRANHPDVVPRIREGTALSGCSFFSSQGRPDSHFTDHNESMLTRITTEMPHTVSIEMETFHLYDLADVSVGHSVHAFGCAMIIAERSNKNFVTPAEKERLVTAWGIPLLDAIAAIPIPHEEEMHGPECCWNKAN
eukprot:GAFH01002868.1.p1 GENE.GAFH01002868.1~~GAFH01002868.1.p1  ORF type:complete len:317 (-),score=91.18 GAFH01002868.1:106-972(-)